MIADPEEHHDRDQVGKMRHDLRDVEHRIENRFDNPIAERPDPEHQAQQH